MLTKAPRASRADTLRFSECSDGGHQLSQLEVQYNPEIIHGLLADLREQVDVKAALIEKDIGFMATSVQQAFHLELIKLPTQVKKMSLSRFREEFGDSLEAVTRGAIGSMGGSKGGSAKGGGSKTVSRTGRRENMQSASTNANATTNKDHVFTTAVKTNTSQSRVFQTPSAQGIRGVAQTPGTALRAPKEGEIMLSENGSPLGPYQATIVKAARPDGGGCGLGFAPPLTPGAVVAPPPAADPASTGAAFNIANLGDMDSVDVSALPDEAKADALAQMQAMMSNMQAMMMKLSGTLASSGGSGGSSGSGERGSRL